MNTTHKDNSIQTLVAIASGEMAGANAQLVNARELHEFLESKQDFSTWIKKRIKDYGFTQDIDFKAPQKNGSLKTTTSAGDKIEYFITVDMAKELGMIERNDKGRQIRRYFIEMERLAKSQYGLKALPSIPAPRAKTMVKGGLELHQQDAINDLIKERMESVPQAARAGMTIRLYSAINTKFETKGKKHGYKNIPPEHFENVMQFIARVPLDEDDFITMTSDEFHYVVNSKVNQAKALPAPEVNLMDRDSLAKLISEQISDGFAKHQAKQCEVMPKKASMSITINLPPLEEGELKKCWLVTNESDEPVMLWEVGPDAEVIKREDFIQQLRDEGMIVFDGTDLDAKGIVDNLPVTVLPSFINAAVQRLTAI